MAKPALRQGRYYLRRRVPKRFETVEARKMIHLSVHTDSEVEAQRKIDFMWADLLSAWQARLDGEEAEATKRLEIARATAQRRGFTFLPAERVAQLPLDEIVQRVEAIMDRKGRISTTDAAAILGGAASVMPSMSELFDLYAESVKDRRTKHTKDQNRVWRQHRVRAIETFKAVNMDLALNKIGNEHWLALRDSLWERVERGEIQADTANKTFQHLGAMIRAVDVRHKLDLGFTGLSHVRFHAEEKKNRVSFSTEWIRTRILAPGALDLLNGEARAILLGMINTGYRPSEGKSLRKEDIRLDTNIPHIFVSGEARALKTAPSRRRIPLVGVSLEAFREYPDGFPRYADSPSLSGTINKFLRDHDLKESEDHTLYCLRHSFEDRLLHADVDERIRRDLMGHSLGDRQRYGEGASLAKMQECLNRIAL